MSFNRILLRLSAASAIANFWREPWPTLAEHLVFDSKIEPIENMEADIVYPTVVVYTDYDKNHIPHQGLPHTSRNTTITFELLMAVLSKSDDDSDLFVLNMPSTDGELEAALDVMEAQVFAALRADNSAADCFSALAYSLDNVVSRRGATTEGGTKIAARQVTYEAKVIQEMANPLLPEWGNRFLTDLAASEGMGPLASRVKLLFEAMGDTDQVERLRQTMGWTTETKRTLGYPLPNAPRLPQDVVWLDQHGNPI